MAYLEVEDNLLDLGERQQALLDIVNKVGKHLPHDKYPQIAVVGNQSAGKSSVLEAITGIPFDRDPEACTRYATEIQLRRDKYKQEVRISIQPASSRDPDSKSRLLAFEHSITGPVDYQQEFRNAHQVITASLTGFASRDKLVVQISGPDQPALTLVDLPGLVATAVGRVGPSDKREIQQLTFEYIQNPLTIILAVIGADAEYGSAAAIMELVKQQFDPEGLRTIGVVTKPDLTEQQNLQRQFVDLINNRDKNNKLNLGWYVLRCQGAKDHWPTRERRASEEAAFFTMAPWNQIPASHWGAASLTAKLQEQLQIHILNHLPDLERIIDERLTNVENELDKFGRVRRNIDEARKDFLGYLQRSSRYTEQGESGDYLPEPAPAFFPLAADLTGSTSLRLLRARVVKQNKLFAAQLRSYRYLEPAEAEAGGGKIPTIGFDGGLVSPDLSVKRMYAETIVARMHEQYIGTHLPDATDHRIPYRIFAEHSRGWRGFATAHLDNIKDICDEFLDEVLGWVWPDWMHQRVLQGFLEPYVDTLHSSARQGVELLLKDLVFEVDPNDPQYEKQLRLWRSQNQNALPEEETLQKAIIYYELALSVFIRNVITQVVERRFMRPIRAVFRSERLGDLLDERAIVSFMSEGNEVSERRRELQSERDGLSERLRDINKMRSKASIQLHRINDSSVKGSSSSGHKVDSRAAKGPAHDGVSEHRPDVRPSPEKEFEAFPAQARLSQTPSSNYVPSPPDWTGLEVAGDPARFRARHSGHPRQSLSPAGETSYQHQMSPQSQSSGQISTPSLSSSSSTWPHFQDPYLARQHGRADGSPQFPGAVNPVDQPPGAHTQQSPPRFAGPRHGTGQQDNSGQQRFAPTNYPAQQEIFTGSTSPGGNLGDAVSSKSGGAASLSRTAEGTSSKEETSLGVPKQKKSAFWGELGRKREG